MAEDITNSIPQEIILRGVIAKNLKQLREKRNLTQEELSIRSGVHQTTIAKHEKCQRTMNLELLLKVAKVLEVSPNELLEGWEPYF